MINIILKLLLVLVLCCQTSNQSTVETIIIETTTQSVTIITDIPQSDVEIALNHDYGRYTTTSFNYINAQFDNLDKRERCYDDYIKCLVTIAVPAPVCLINEPDISHNVESYCEAYFDNCLTGFRYWRILNLGLCKPATKDSSFNIILPRRYLSKHAPKFLLT